MHRGGNVTTALATGFRGQRRPFPPRLGALRTPARRWRSGCWAHFRSGDRTASIVDRGEWRTGKVSDLLRLLALRGGEPVATQSWSRPCGPARISVTEMPACEPPPRRCGGSSAASSSNAAWPDFDCAMSGWTSPSFVNWRPRRISLTGRGEIVAADAVARRGRRSVPGRSDRP